MYKTIWTIIALTFKVNLLYSDFFPYKEMNKIHNYRKIGLVTKGGVRTETITNCH